jgi:excisionase family DNA binding protein
MPRESLPRGDTMDDLERLALRPREAAAMLGISSRTLWSWTKAGLLPYVKIGKTLRYPVDELRAWLADQSRNMADPAQKSETAEGPADA